MCTVVRICGACVCGWVGGIDMYMYMCCAAYVQVFAHACDLGVIMFVHEWGVYMCLYMRVGL